MRVRLDMAVPAIPGVLEGILEGLVLANCELMDRSALPPLYYSGVRYRRERSGRDKWQTCEQVYSNRSGDCEDLCAWRTAELRRRGEDLAECIVRKAGPKMWHVLVLRADGSIEDPSRILGMGSDEDA